MAFRAQEIRKDFPVLANGVVYLDSAATAQRPLQVIRAEADFYSKVGANAHRGVYGLAVRSTGLYEDARAVIAGFVNAGPDQLVFVRNTTEAINLVAWSWAVQRAGQGKNIVTTVMEHHSNLVPWQLLSQRTGCELRFAGLTDDGLLDLDELAGLIDNNTVLVAVAHVSNVLGVVNPIERIAAMAHEHNAACLVDGAQGIPHQQVDFGAIGCDFYAFSGHKMMGPMGIGGLLIARERLGQMQPFMGGGEMIDQVKLDRATYAKPPLMFEAGTQNVGGAIGLAAAVRYLKELTMQQVTAHERMLGEYAHSRVGRLSGIRIVDSSCVGPCTGILTFDVKGHHPHDVAQFLDQRGIAIRAGDHCAQPLHERLGLTATNRASFYVYNTLADVDALVDALKGLVSGARSVSLDGVISDYEETIDHHFLNPLGRQPLAEWDVEKHGKNALCGDELVLRLQIRDHRVMDVHADAKGCKVSQASASLMVGAIKGQPIDKAIEIVNDVQSALMRREVELSGDLAALKPLASMPARLKCALLAWKTAQEALNDDESGK